MKVRGPEVFDPRLWHAYIPMCRAPKSRDVPRVLAPDALFPCPQKGVYAKWWAVELRFDSPLARRQVRILQGFMDGYTCHLTAGCDGVYMDQSWDDYLYDAHQVALEGVLRRIGVRGVVRAAPFGRDCPGGQACPHSYDDMPEHQCAIGDVASTSPIFSFADWFAFDPRQLHPRSIVG